MSYPKTRKIVLPDVTLSKIFKIPSDDNARLKHSVSLKEMTCDCADFITHISRFGKDDFRRTCRHIRSAIVQSNIIGDSWLRKLIGDRFEHEYYYVPPNKDCAFGYSSENPWIQFYGIHYTTKKGTKVYYGRFSYSVTEKRWSSNQEPMNAPEIAAMIEELFPATESQRKWKPSPKNATITISLADILNENK